MSYLSAIIKHDQVLVWERNEPSKRKLVAYPAEHYCYVEDEDGTDTTIYGDTVQKQTFNTNREMQEWVDDNKGDLRIFESDISADLRLLSKKYYNVPAPKLNTTYLDIEVDYDRSIGFSSPENPYAPINAIALYHEWKKDMVILAVPPNAESYEGNPEDLDPKKLKRLMNDVCELPGDTSNTIMLFENEKQLLNHFIEEIGNSDILSGWNSGFFDVPYIGKRLMLLDGISSDDVSNTKAGKLFKRLSINPGGSPRWRQIERYGAEHYMLDLVGRVSLDYMDLFRKYEMAERPSYKLEAIADEILPELPKLEYEGSLASLYTTNFPWFCRYNFRDTEILKGFEEKLGYVELANQMVHLSTGLFKHVGGTLKLAELATVNFCHHELNQVVNNIKGDSDSGSIQGAFVLIPQVGLQEQIGSLDINSLYPSAIRSINISPETLIGQFTRNIKDAEEIAKGSEEILILLTDDGDVLRMSAKQWRSVLFEEKWAVSGYGTVFDQNVKGIIPTILEKWYATRKEYQHTMVECKKEMNDFEPASEEYIELKQQAAYYDRLQYVYKIKLNSFYGALTNAYFRFFDSRMGESTTGTGRAILLHQCAQAVKELSGEYTLPDKICVKMAKGKDKGKYIQATQEQLDDPDITIHHGYSDKYPIVYGDSVAGDSKIELPHNKSINIEHLFGSVDYTIGDKEYSNCSSTKVLTFNKETGQNEFQNIKYVMRHKVNKRMYRVWLGNTRYLDVTEDHSLIGYANSKSKYTGLVEIKPTEIGKNNVNSLILNRHIPITSLHLEQEDLSNEMCQLIGFIIGDGHVEKKKESGVGLSVGSMDKEEIITKLIQPLIEQGWFTSIVHMKNGHDIRLYGVKGWKFLRTNLYPSNTKQFPEWIFNISVSQMAAVLRGYFSADGFANKTRIIGLCSVNMQFITTAHRLLKYCGIPSNFWTEQTENSFNGKFSGTFTKRLTVYNGPAFSTSIGFIQDRKNKNVQTQYTRNTSHMKHQSGYVHVQPTKIEEIQYDDYVYDIEVESTHMFYANDLLVHNTDSSYFSTGYDNNEESIARADELGELVNDSFPQYMRDTFMCQPGYDSIIKTGREIVSDRGLFVDKKRYMLHIINDDGFPVDKCKVMGLDTKKTTLPKEIANKLNKFVERYLKGEPWDTVATDVVTYKEELSNITESTFMNIGLPKGIKNVGSYTESYNADPTCFLPGHVSAAVHFNLRLIDEKDTETIPIHSGDKIRVFYLTQKNGRFKSIAISGDIEQIPDWVVEKILPIIDVPAHIERLIDKPLNNIIKSVGLISPSKQSMFIDSLLEF